MTEYKMVATSLRALRSGDKSALMRSGPQPLSAADRRQAAVDAKAWAAAEAERERTAYRKARQAEYPAIGDQLDALFKHLASTPPETHSPELATVLATIQAVKAKYPKPAAPEAVPEAEPAAE